MKHAELSLQSYQSMQSHISPIVPQIAFFVTDLIQADIFFYKIYTELVVMSLNFLD